jgi:hypothetical protein
MALYRMLARALQKFEHIQGKVRECFLLLGFRLAYNWFNISIVMRSEWLQIIAYLACTRKRLNLNPELGDTIKIFIYECLKIHGVTSRMSSSYVDNKNSLCLKLRRVFLKHPV